MTRLLTRRRVAILCVVALGLAAAWLFAPILVAVLLTIAVGGIAAVLTIPSTIEIFVHGPGYQYRDKTGRGS